MDCRKSLCVALWLVGGLAGCTLTNPTPITSISPPMTSNQVVDVPIKKEVDLPKRAPHAEPCWRYGDFAAEEACAPNKNPVQMQELRDIARKAYQQALSLDPKCLPAHEGLARLYVAMKDYPRATKTYLDAQRYHPKAASLCYELGMCYAQQKAWEPALKNLTKATELEPENRLYNNFLGYALARAGRYDASLKVFERLETEQEAHFRLAWMLKHVNETDLARQHLQAALQRDPDMRPAIGLLAELDGKPLQPEKPQAEGIQQTNFAPENPVQAPEAPPAPVTDPAPMSPTPGN